MDLAIPLFTYMVWGSKHTYSTKLLIHVHTFLVFHWEKPAYHACSLGFLYGKIKTVRAKMKG